jgi:polyisoprenoid-binding protein YceI
MSARTRRRLVIVVGGLVAIAVLVIAGTYLYVNVISGDAPDPLALDTAAPGDGEDGPGGELADLEGTWQVADGSQAGYRVDEVLNGQDNTVVGRTDGVSGEITVADGAATAGEIVVDMTTVTTDSDARDSQFRGSIMDTSQFPTATFTLSEPVPLDELDGSGPISLTAAGELTVRDVTRPVEAQLDLQVSGQDVQVAGSVPVTFADFEIEPPDLGFVRVEDAGLVEFLLTFTKS